MKRAGNAKMLWKKPENDAGILWAWFWSGLNFWIWTSDFLVAIFGALIFGAIWERMGTCKRR